MHDLQVLLPERQRAARLRASTREDQVLTSPLFRITGGETTLSEKEGKEQLHLATEPLKHGAEKTVVCLELMSKPKPLHRNAPL